jgi:SOS response regulatory protein OraA/RecX
LKRKYKLMTYLIGRGFEQDIVNNIISKNIK